jgi:putative hydrolase of HD superfamily
MHPDVHRLIELQKLLAAFNEVEREVHRKHKGTYIGENDTEHSYNLAMTAWYLSKWFPELDKNLLIQYAMVHDLVEVYAGDTFIYGTQEELASKEAREAEAFARLSQEWSDFPDMIEAIHIYETKKNPEARFIYALDKLIPVMLVYIHDGFSWKKHDVSVEMLYTHKEPKVSLAPELLPYLEQLNTLLLAHPELIKKA